MLPLGTWIRECDADAFARFFARHPGIVVKNARTEPVDLDAMRGLLISGGPDISAAFHLEPPSNPGLIIEPEPERDAWEFAALRHALSRGLPILCICKGFQVLNIALGGTLHLHIRGHDLPDMKYRNVQPLRYDRTAQHQFELVNSSHHQSLDRVAESLQVEAWHAGDDTIEQVKVRDYPWAVGVQYHPERDMIYAPLFDDFFRQLTP